MLVRVENGRIIKVEGDPNHPINEGARCVRNYGWREFHDHPDRLNYPLKRIGNRGAGEWQRISWSQALSEIASELNEIQKKYGAEALASAGGTNRTDDWARKRFFNLFGSPNVFHIAHVCWCNCFAIESAIHGWAAGPDLTNSKCIVVWGHNAAVSYLPTMRFLQDAKEKYGTKLIVIDPRFTETASKANLWIQNRPGTDAALALAWLNIIITEGLYDRDFVEKWTIGFDKLRERVKDYSPKKVAKITWVSEEKIIESARIYATSRPSSILWGNAVDGIGRNAGYAAQARAILRVITGDLDAQGGSLISGPNPLLITDAEMELNEMLSADQRRKQLGSDRFKIMTWPGYELISKNVEKVWGKPPPAEWMCEAHPPTVWRAMTSGKPYPVKALIVVANNPLTAYANSKLVYEALKSLDLLVVVDFWLTPTAMLADYVLPSATWLERPVITTSFGCSDHFIASERPIKPLYERRTDYQFWRGLAIRLGQEKFWPWESLEDANGYRLEPLGYGSYEKFVKEIRFDFPPISFKKYMKTGFGTPSGKVELYSTIFKELGYDPLPYYEEPAESPYSTPKLAEEYPLILIAGGNFMPYHHSEERQISSLRRIHPDPLVEIHPETARKLGIFEGDWVWIETQRGKVKQRARITLGIDPRVVCAQKGWWFPEKPSKEPSLGGVWESNINVVTDDDPENCDNLCGSWYIRALLCKIYKA